VLEIRKKLAMTLAVEAAQLAQREVVQKDVIGEDWLSLCFLALGLLVFVWAVAGASVSHF
jgi:hypothetical protein